MKTPSSDKGKGYLVMGNDGSLYDTTISNTTGEVKRKEWEKRFQKKYWGLCFECCDFEKLLDDIDDLLHQRDNEIREKILNLKEEYKNNEDYANYGTLDENICHDDGYKDCINDVISLLDI